MPEVIISNCFRRFDLLKYVNQLAGFVWGVPGESAGRVIPLARGRSEWFESHASQRVVSLKK
jgi:hypothetical protein